MSIDNKPEPENPEKKPENPQKPNKPNNVKTCCIGCLVIFLFISIIGQINRYVTEHRKPPQPTQAEVENQQKINKAEWKRQQQEARQIIKDNRELDRIGSSVDLVTKAAYDSIPGLLDSQITVSRPNDKDGICLDFALIVESDTTEEQARLIATGVLSLMGVTLPEWDNVKGNYKQREEKSFDNFPWEVYNNYTMRIIVVADENTPRERIIYIGLHQRGTPCKGLPKENLMLTHGQ